MLGLNVSPSSMLSLFSLKKFEHLQDQVQPVQVPVQANAVTVNHRNPDVFKSLPFPDLENFTQSAGAALLALSRLPELWPTLEGEG